MEAVTEVLEFSIAGVTVRAMVVALLALTIGFIIGNRIELWCRRFAAKAPERSIRRAALQAFDRPIGWTVRVVGIWLALNVMPLEAVKALDVDRLIAHLAQGATVALATWLGVRIINEVGAIFAARAAKTEGAFDDQLVPVARKTAKVFLVITGTVMVVQNLGYSVTSLLAGVGIGGAALAFASKDAVANIFGSIVIFVDRPFMIGDWIEVGDVEGTVETVGIRVTTVRTFANDATPDKLRMAVDAIRGIIRSDDRLHQDFFLVNFFDFGASSLDIFCYLFTRTTGWAEHMQIREEFMLKVMEAMSSLGLSFAFPTRTVHLEGGGLPQQAANDGSPRQPAGAPAAMLRETPL
jgi:MscS family membrane protein